MARSRNIKPGFFTNDVLCELPPLARILFAGLWCHADREGRLQDRPKKIKAEILPYDTCQCDRLLEDLHEAGFIFRYVVQDVGYIQVLEFTKHQNPHVKELLSTIPAPDLPGARTRTPDQHQSSTVLAPEIPEPARLIPDSLNLIPDSLQQMSASACAESPPSQESIPYKAIVDLYHASMTNLPKVRELTISRKTALRQAWQMNGARRSLDFWKAYFEECADDKFLNGTGPYLNGHENWRPSFDYLLKPKTITGVYEKAMDRLDRAVHA